MQQHALPLLLLLGYTASSSTWLRAQLMLHCRLQRLALLHMTWL
jgi:hypothetical protein